VEAMTVTGIDSELLNVLENNKNSTIQVLLKEVRRFNNRLGEEDEIGAIMCARKSLDYILRGASELSGIKAGTKPLDQIISELVREKILPPVIENHCRIIKDFGNVAAHGFSSITIHTDEMPSDLSMVEAQICSYSMIVVLSWYISKIMPKVKEMFPFKILHGAEITPEQILEAIGIDENIFNPEFQGIYDRCLEWFAKNPDIYTFIIDRNINKVVGYINAMPIEEDFLTEIETGELMDVDIPASAIRTYDLPDIYKMFLCSIAVHQNYQGTIAFKMLYEAFIEKLIRLAADDIFFSEIVADAVTSEGEKLATFIGMKKFKESSHNSNIYKVSLLPPSLRVTTDRGKSLRIIYDRKYQEYKDLLMINDQIL
jgi:hypothetical protein